MAIQVLRATTAASRFGDFCIAGDSMVVREHPERVIANDAARQQRARLEVGVTDHGLGTLPFLFRVTVAGLVCRAQQCE